MHRQQHPTIDNHIRQLGFSDVYAFALHQLISTNENQLTDHQSSIAAFEQKYNMNFDEFQEQFHDITIDLFEKEDDSMEWEVRLAMQEEIKDTLTQLKRLINTDDDQA